MPAVPGGTEIGTVYVAAPMALTLNWPARLIAGGCIGPGASRGQEEHPGRENLS